MYHLRRRFLLFNSIILHFTEYLLLTYACVRDEDKIPLIQEQPDEAPSQVRKETQATQDVTNNAGETAELISEINWSSLTAVHGRPPPLMYVGPEAALKPSLRARQQKRLANRDVPESTGAVSTDIISESNWISFAAGHGHPSSEIHVRLEAAVKPTSQARKGRRVSAQDVDDSSGVATTEIISERD